MNKSSITDREKLLFQLIVMDDFVKTVFNVDGEDAKSIYLRNDGLVIYARNKNRWINYLFGQNRSMSLIDFTAKAIKAISGQANNKNIKVENGLIGEMVNHAIRNDNPREMIDALFAVLFFKVDGKIKTNYLQCHNEEPSRYVPNHAQEIHKCLGTIQLNSGQTLGDLSIKFKY